MAINLHRAWLLVALFTIGVAANCTSYGVDYSNGGSYDIDTSSSQYFSFQTVFQGCTAESITPYLVDPSGNQYVCTAINVTASEDVITSTCGIPYSSMQSGQWKIILSGEEIAVQRVIGFTAGIPTSVTITITPTIVLGVTSTPNAITIYKTVIQTRTSILLPATVTTACNEPTQVITITPTPSTVFRTSTAVETITDTSITSTSLVIIIETAVCHRSTGYTSRPDTTPTPVDPRPSVCHKRRTCRPTWTATSGHGGGWGWNIAELAATDVASVPETLADTNKRDATGVATVTVSYTETTFTVTETSITTIAAATTTKKITRTMISTLVPAPTTLCQGDKPGTTITITRPYDTVTETDAVYSTSHLATTIWIGKTEYSVVSDPVSSIACLRGGGQYGP